MTPLLTICGVLAFAGLTWLAWELWRAPLIDDADERSGEGEPKGFRGIDAVGGGADRTFHSQSTTHQERNDHD